MLIPLSQLSHKIIVKPVYFSKKIPGSVNECYAREGAAKRLLKAVETLPKNHFFHVFDAWRPFKVQMELYLQLKRKLEAMPLTEKQLEQKLNKYVDQPSRNPANPSNHITGGAIDLTLGAENGLLDMGTNFDDFSDLSRTNAFENINKDNQQTHIINENRLLLKSIMESAGFTNYSEEWWHYDYGNQNWGMATNNTAIYSAILALDNSSTVHLD